MSSPKNVLFINPWIYDFTAYDFWLKPLGFLYLAEVVRRHGRVKVHFIDCLDRSRPQPGEKPGRKADGRGPFHKEEVPKPAVLKNVPRRYSRYGIPVSRFLQELDGVPTPDAVFLTCTMTYWYPGVQAVTDLVRKKFGRVPIVLGGIYATLLPDHARSHSGADIVVRGAGEDRIFEVLREIFGDGFRHDARFNRLDDLPQPAFDLLRDRTWLPILSSRGCPFRCTFCASRLLHERFEQRDPLSVASEIEGYFRRYGTRHFSFYDDALLLNKQNHIIPLLQAILRKDIPVNFHTPNGLHIREIDAGLADLLWRSRVASLYLSQETFDEELLEAKTPKVKPGDLERVLRHLENAGYRRRDISVYLIAGLPGQDASGIRESIRNVQRLGATPRLAFFSPIPGTVEWENLVASGTLPRDGDPLLFNKLTFPYVWGTLTPDDFRAIKALLE